MPARSVCWFFPAVLCFCLFSAAFPWPAFVHAQIGRPAATPPTDDFRQTVRKSGLIFDGTVTAIEREAGAGNTPQTYRISFRVKQGLRGVRTGATLTIREWAGLWVDGPGSGASAQRPRYRVGERTVLFLYPASRAGLTSPVGGRKGKLAVNRAGQVVLPLDWTRDWGAEQIVDRTKDWTRTPGPIVKQSLSHSPSQVNQVPLGQLVQRIQQAGGE